MPTRVAEDRVSTPRNAPTIENAARVMDDCGYSSWTVNYVLPRPYPRPEITFAVECTRPTGQGVQRHIFSFRQVGSRLEIFDSYAEDDYINAIRRTGKDLTPYYEAVQKHRRLLVAKVLAGDSDVQLILPPIVDDDEFRKMLTSKAYRKAQFAKDAAIKVRDKMNRVRSELASRVESAPLPVSPRGRRAADASARGRQRQERRNRNRRPEVASPPEVAFGPAVAEALVRAATRQPVWAEWIDREGQ